MLKVGQRHGGLFGAIQSALERAASHIWFERAEVKDRMLVGKRYVNQAQMSTKHWEGTCTTDITKNFSLCNQTTTMFSLNYIA